MEISESAPASLVVQPVDTTHTSENAPVVTTFDETNAQEIPSSDPVTSVESNDGVNAVEIAEAKEAEEATDGDDSASSNGSESIESSDNESTADVDGGKKKKKLRKKRKLRRVPSKSRWEKRFSVLAQPKHSRDKFNPLLKRVSSRDLFFGQMPQEGSGIHYLTHNPLENKMSAQSAFKSATALNGKVPFGHLPDSSAVELQHGEKYGTQAPREANAPFGTTEGKFHMFEFFHYNYGSEEQHSARSHFSVGEPRPSLRPSLGSEASRESTPNPRLNSFLQKHKHFRSTGDFSSLKNEDSRTSNRPILPPRRSNSSAQLRRQPTSSRLSKPSPLTQTNSTSSLKGRSKKMSRKSSLAVIPTVPVAEERIEEQPTIENIVSNNEHIPDVTETSEDPETIEETPLIQEELTLSKESESFQESSEPVVA